MIKYLKQLSLLFVSLIVFPVNAIKAEENQGEYIIESTVSWPSIEQSFEEQEALSLSTNELTEVASQVQAVIEQIDESSDEMSIYVQLGSELLSKGEDSIVTLDADGLIQLFIAVAYYQQLETGILNGDEKILLTDDHIITSGVLANLPMDQKYTYKDLIQLMLQSNDLSATNIMLKELGGSEKLTSIINELGFLQTSIVNDIEQELAQESDAYNQTSAADVANLLLALFQGVLFEDELNEEVLKMISQHGPTGLVAELEQGTTYYGKLSQGFLPLMTNDAVLFEVLDNQPLVIVIMAKALNEDVLDLASIGNQIVDEIKGSVE